MGTLTVGVLGAMAFGGCATLVRIPLAFELPAQQGTFVVTGGQAEQNAFVLTGSSDAPDISSGTMRLDPGAITFTPADTTDMKGTAAAHVVQTINVTVWIGELGDVDTVCGGGDEYGPFAVGIGEEGLVEEIDPNSVALRRSTVDLINSGEFSGCIRVESPVDATVTINKLDFTVSP
jgi:hypothetical protein